MYAGDVRTAYPDWILMGGIDASQLLRNFGVTQDELTTVTRGAVISLAIAPKEKAGAARKDKKAE